MVTIKRPIHPSKRKQSILPISAWILIVGIVYFFFFEYGPKDPNGPEKDSPGYYDRTTNSKSDLLTNSKQSLQNQHHVENHEAPEDGLKHDDAQQQDQDVAGTDGDNVGSDHHHSSTTTNAAAGYFLDFAYERQYPSYREIPIKDWSESEDHVHMSLPNQGSFRSCQYISDQNKILIHSDKCGRSKQQEEQKQLIAYNTLSVSRTWCGQVIGPRSAVTLQDPSCSEPVKLLPRDRIPLDGTDMPPIIIQSHDGQAQNTRNVENCDIPCQEEANMLDTNFERYIQGQPSWKLIVSNQDPQRNRGVLEIARTAFRKDIYYSTTSFQSSVPQTNYDFDQFPLFEQSAVQWDDVQDSASYLQSIECNAMPTKRGRWSGAVMESYTVASYGNCNHNTDVPAGMSLESKKDRLELRRKHKFDIAIEFGNQKDHITSIVWESLESGTVPIIFGANNIIQHLPKHSFVDVGRFQYFHDLGEYIANTLSKNKTEWESYQTWRTDPNERKKFEQLYEFSKTSASCRICRWAYAKQYGLGWNHVKQQIQDTVLPRTLCLNDEQSLITQPFLETWIVSTSGDDGAEERERVIATTLSDEKTNCDVKTSTSSTMTIDDDVFTRTVVEHDNVIDVSFQLKAGQNPKKDHDLIMKLEFPIKNREGAYFPNAHLMVGDGSMIRGSIITSIALQDRKSKITILASWNTMLVTETGKEGVVLLKVHAGSDDIWHEEDEIRRVRIIIEDLNQLHDKMTEYYPSSFGKLMIQDFVDPLELFYLE